MRWRKCVLTCQWRGPRRHGTSTTSSSLVWPSLQVNLHVSLPQGVVLEVDNSRVELLVRLLDAGCGRDLGRISCSPGRLKIIALTRNLH